MNQRTQLIKGEKIVPYIDPEFRRLFDYQLDQIIAELKTFSRQKRVGCLNYCFTRLAAGGLLSKDRRYSEINDIMGVFSCAAQEFYDRVARPKEDVAIASNGDVNEYGNM